MDVALKYISRTPIICASDINKPLFYREEPVVVLDVDGVLMRQSSNFHNGERGFDTYYPYDASVNFVYRLQRRFGRENVVLWSAYPNYLEYFDGKLFHNVAQHVVGLSEMDLGGLPVMCKNLEKVHINTRLLVAVEDAATESDCCFFPTGRVVRVLPNRPRHDYSGLFQQIIEKF